MPCSGASFFIVAVMGEERFVPYGYVASRDIPVRIEDAAFLWSKGVRNLSTPLEIPFGGNYIAGWGGILPPHLPR